MSELFGAHLATGSVDAILWRSADAFYQPYEKLLRRTRASPAVNIGPGKDDRFEAIGHQRRWRKREASA